MKKSILAFLLALCLFATTMVVPVQAAVNETTTYPTSQAQPAPDVCGDEGIGKDVVYYQDVSTAYLQPSEAEAYQIMIGLRSKFPHGMTFTNRHYYAWKGCSDSYYFGGGYGCAGFCFYLSDACFGSTPAERIYNFTYDQIKVGDCLRINNDTHIVTVMEKYNDHIVVAEANYDDMVYWGRTFTRSQVMEITTFLLTRYGKWQQTSSGWKYVFVDGTYVTGWGRIQGKWYYFNSNGLMQTGIITVGGKKYALDSQSGAMITGWINHTVSGVTYRMYANASGEILTGWQRIGDYWYVFGGNGYMKTGWYQEGSSWYYLDTETGAMYTGTHTINGTTYTFNGSGVWQSGQSNNQKNGWAQENGKWYYYKNGAKQTGWLQQGSVWYYLDSTGAMVTGEYVIGGKTHIFNGSGVWQGEKTATQKNGWVKEDGDWYYYKNGSKHVGWLQLGGKWYAFTNEGKMIIGWGRDNNKYYYFNGNGEMQVGWQKINGAWYYFAPGGAMVTGEYTINGKVNIFDEDGIWQGEKVNQKNGWEQESGNWYYYKNGQKHTGWLQLSGNWYYFNSAGVMQTGLQTIGGKIYAFTNDGTMLIGWIVDGAGNYYYADSSGALLVGGWHEIDGQWYYFNNSGIFQQAA